MPEKVAVLYVVCLRDADGRHLKFGIIGPDDDSGIQKAISEARKLSGAKNPETLRVATVQELHEIHGQVVQ